MIENSRVYSSSDISDWSAVDWSNKAGTGIHADGTHLVVRNKDTKNVSFGMYLYGDDILAEKDGSSAKSVG